MKEYKCRKINTNFKIDGNMDKPEWKSADGAMLVDTVTGRKAKLGACVKLLWNDEFLYAGFYCEDDGICATMTGYNDYIYEEDVVELFLDDDNDLKTYIEIEVSPINTLLHYFVHNDMKGKILYFARIEKNIDSAVIFDEAKRVLTVEIAIPFSEFMAEGNNPPHVGDKWRANFYRIDRKKEGEDEYTAWSPTGKVDYHLPDKFGTLIFI